MKLVYTNGGLANQMYQYIFYRYLCLSTKQEIFLDTSLLENRNQHNGFELSKVFPKAEVKLLKDKFDADVWELMKEEMGQDTFITEVLSKNQRQFHVLVEGTILKPEHFFSDKEQQETYIHYLPAETFQEEGGIFSEVSNDSAFPNVYYAGYFIHDKYLSAFEETIKKELQFPPLPVGANTEYQTAIQKAHSVGVHVRRGDFLDSSVQWGLPADYYQQVITSLKIQEKGKNPLSFFVFSDDLQWCKDHASEMGFTEEDSVTFVEGNTGEASYLDLQLMCECGIIIGSRSSFSVATTYLSSKLKQYITPPPRTERFSVD